MSVARQLDKLRVPRDAYDGIVSSGDVTRAVIAVAARPEPVSYRARARPLDLRRARRALRAAGERRLRGLLRAATTTTSRRRRIIAARLETMLGAQAVHGLRQSRRGGRARRRSWSIAPARSPISTPPWAARCSMPASPTGRSTTWRWLKRRPSRRRKVPAAARAGDRRFGAHRSQGRARRRRRFPVRDRRHPRRGAGRRARGPTAAALNAAFAAAGATPKAVMRRVGVVKA